MRSPKSSKSDIYTEGVAVYAAAMSVEVGAHYPGRPAVVSMNVLRASRGVRKRRQESAEGIVGRLDPAEGPNMTRTMETE